MELKVSRRKRGRPELDLALRVRNWGWYWLVKNEAELPKGRKTRRGHDPDMQLSDDHLDELFASEESETGGRLRAFWQVKKYGNSPDKKQSGRAETSLYERVHQGGNCPEAQQWFEAKIWTILSEPGLQPAYFSSAVTEAIEKNGWFRMPADEAYMAAFAIGDRAPVLHKGLTPTYSAMLHHITNWKSAESLTLLSALYREAVADFELEVASVYETFLQVQVELIGKRFEFPKWLLLILKTLIADRVLRNHWIVESDMQMSSETHTSRLEKLKAFIGWYLDAQCPARSKSSAGYPIVRSTPKTDWLRDNRLRLKKLYAAHGVQREQSLAWASNSTSVDESEVKKRMENTLWRAVGKMAPPRKSKAECALSVSEINVDFDGLPKPSGW